MNCITIQHCIVRQWAGEKAVSRYNYCIVTEEKRGRWARAERAGGRAWALGWALQAAGRGRGAQLAGGRAEQEAAGVRGARQAGLRRWARGARAAWARELATGCALGALGLFSIRFDSVLFLSWFLDIIREPGS